MHYEIVDGELCIMDNYELRWIYERENFSRACYKFMTNWVEKNTEPDLENPEENWTKAEQAWDVLSEAEKGQLFYEVLMEQQNAKDLCQGLLANLSFYQGLKHVKKAFEYAIKSVSDSFA